MKNFYYYKFYWILKAFEGKVGYKYANAILIFSLLIYLQFASAMNVVYLITDWSWTDYFLTDNRVLNRFVIWPIILSPFFLTTTFFYLKNKKAILRLIKIYRTEDPERAKRNGRCVRNYVIITVSFLILSIIGGGAIAHELDKRRKKENIENNHDISSSCCTNHNFSNYQARVL